MSDLATGYTFTNGETNVTHTKLNSAVNDATIQTGAITDKTAKTTPLAADQILLYDDAGVALKRATLDNAVYNNDLLLTGRTGFTTPVAADELMIYDTTASSLKKITRTNLFYEWWDLANLQAGTITEHISPISEDRLLVRDVTLGASHYLKIGRIIGYLPARDVGTNPIIDTDRLPIYDVTTAVANRIIASEFKDYCQTGGVVQVVQTVKTDTESLVTTGAWTDIPGMSVAITPRDANSKIMVRAVVNGYQAGASHFRLVRDATAIGVGDASSSRIQCGASHIYPYAVTNNMATIVMEYLDSAAWAGSHTFKVQYYISSGAGLFINRSSADTDDTNHGRTASMITVTEIGA